MKLPRLFSLALLPGAALLSAAAPVTPCDSIAGKSFGTEVTIRSATLVPAKGNMPEHCDVRGSILPEAGFAVKRLFLAKQVIAAYYGTGPKYSYWVGCSTGGRLGLQEA